MKVYVISGLGVDRRAFQNIIFHNADVEFLDWISPIDNDSMASYAARLSERITARAPIIIGLSFGGMIAVEISKIIDHAFIILISSAKNKYEIPKLYRLPNYFDWLLQAFPYQSLTIPNPLAYWFFGIEKAADKELFAAIIRDSDTRFLKWAIGAIVHWDNTIEPKNYIHIHSKSDKILPISNIKNIHSIIDGGHFAIVTNPQPINAIINAQLHPSDTF